ncbi:MAG TPA: DUF4124 domain-containing protein [Gammaproteobacteria bacterium]
MRYFLLLLALLFMNAAVPAETYKWVDKDGNVHYSDTPVEGAETVELPEPTTFNAPDLPDRPSPSDETDSEEAAAAAYTGFAFISPKQDQVFWAAGGEIPVQLDVKPLLRQTHQIRLFYNGELVSGFPSRSAGTTLTGVYRGAHTVRAEIVDWTGDAVATAGPVTFHVKQRSIQNPQN